MSSAGPEPSTLSEVAGVVILEMWGGENVYTFQTVGGQNGQNDVAFTDASVDDLRTDEPRKVLTVDGKVVWESEERDEDDDDEE